MRCISHCEEIAHCIACATLAGLVCLYTMEVIAGLHVVHEYFYQTQQQLSLVMTAQHSIFNRCGKLKQLCKMAMWASSNMLGTGRGTAGPNL